MPAGMGVGPASPTWRPLGACLGVLSSGEPSHVYVIVDGSYHLSQTVNFVQENDHQ
jgi:hypothetical protein